MTKVFLTFLLLATSLFAELINQPLTKKLLNSNIPIVDIRTPGEWKETGITKDAVRIMFFDERGQYNVEAFLDELNKKVDTKKQFALICRTGSRTKVVSSFLSQKLGYNVINIQGGITQAIRRGLPVEPYRGR
ncbi:MAG: rhodanese-like domain-containing protein [Epsilonproteobacteria bacterium]|nr:MAG: rhodanese-like domain-containing protein [Campylobacterota bacterium]